MFGLINTDKGSQKEDKPIPFSIGSHIHESSYTSLITPEQLDGTTYMKWSLNAEIKICGIKHWGYITGTRVAPADTKSEAYEVWDDTNSLVKSWLLDAMTKDIRSLFLRLPTAQKIWEAIKRNFYTSKWGFHHLLFWELLRIWQELDAIDECIMECANDILTYTTKGAMSRDKIREGAVMVTKTTSTSKKDLKCTHYNGTGHIIDNCFKLHGYPDWHPKGKKASQTTSQPKGNLTTALGFNPHSEHPYQGEDWQW
ncbi:hypothetical protein CsSME_00016842 [Camellia sinensis var. sinensis]